MGLWEYGEGVWAGFDDRLGGGGPDPFQKVGGSGDPSPLDICDGPVIKPWVWGHRIFLAALAPTKQAIFP